MPNIRDTFALPRDPDHAIHLMEGAWEFRTEAAADELCYTEQGWRVIHRYADKIVLKFTHHERCGCRRIHE